MLMCQKKIISRCGVKAMLEFRERYEAAWGQQGMVRIRTDSKPK